MPQASHRARFLHKAKGGAAGYVKSRSLKQGSSGTPVPQSLTTYIQRPAGVATVYPVAASTASGSFSTACRLVSTARR